MLCNNRNIIVKNDVNRRVVVRRHHIGEDGRIRLKCTASVLDLYWRTAEEVAQVTKQAIGNGQFFMAMRFSVFFPTTMQHRIFAHRNDCFCSTIRTNGFSIGFPILRTDGFERSLKNAYSTTHSNSRLSAQRCDSNDASLKLITKTQIQRWYFSLVGWDNLFWSGDEVGQELLVSPILLLSTHLPSAQPPSPHSPPSPPTHLKNSFHPLGSHFSLYPSFPLGSPAHHSLCYC